MTGKSNKGSERLLTLKGNVWWFRKQVPDACRKILAKKSRYCMASLGTSDIKEAKPRRDELDAITQLQFRQVIGGQRTALDLPEWGQQARNKQALSAAERGALVREAIAEMEGFPELVNAHEGEFNALEIARNAAEDEADALRPTQRQAFMDAFIGRVEIDHHLQAFLKISDLAPKTVSERRGLIGRCASWCREKSVNLSEVDRRVAGRYVAEVIDPMHPATQRKHLTALRSYWKFLARRGHIELPTGEPLSSGWPWNGQQLEKRGARVERGAKKDNERAFTDEEVRKLLYSPFPLKHTEWEAQILDALCISLLSGMRLAEVLTLWVEEVHDGLFDIQQGKTEAAAREVPIHTDLFEIVDRRTRGKAPKDWLFHELQHERDGPDTFGKRFKRFRESAGVDDKREGIRRSLVNFHSARRWFVTKARHAGQPRETIANIVGHLANKSDVTFGVYAREASDTQRRACVEAVALPKQMR